MSSHPLTPVTANVMIDSLPHDVYHYLHSVIANASLEPVYAQSLHHILKRISESHHEVVVLPLIACQAAGGSPEQAVPVAAAWRALHIAARLLDDAEDGDIRHWAQDEQASARIINLGTGFIGIANLALAQADKTLSAEQRLTLSQRFNQTMMVMAGGQHLDLLPEGVTGLEAYWRHIQGKSGAFFGLAVQGGALCAITDKEALDRYYEFGYNLGVMLQLINDLNGFFAEGPHDDLASGKRTAPIFFIEDFAPAPVQSALQALLLQAPHDLNARQRIRKIAKEQGADAYILAETARRRAQARHSLLPADDPDGALEELLEKFVNLPEH